MVKTPEWSTSCMFAASLRPWTTASFVDHEKWFVTVDQRQSAGKGFGRQAEVVLLPVARQVLCPLLDGTSRVIRPGQPTAMKGQPQLLFLCGLDRLFDHDADVGDGIVAGRIVLLVAPREDFQMPALVMSPFLILSSTMPTRRLAPPISAAMMACRARPGSTTAPARDQALPHPRARHAGGARRRLTHANLGRSEATVCSNLNKLQRSVALRLLRRHRLPPDVTSVQARAGAIRTRQQRTDRFGDRGKYGQ